MAENVKGQGNNPGLNRNKEQQHDQSGGIGRNQTVQNDQSSIDQDVNLQRGWQQQQRESQSSDMNRSLSSEETGYDRNRKR